MAAIAEPVHHNEVLPVCLAPWQENPYRLVSLWTVLTFSAREFYWIGQYLEKSFEDCLHAASGSGTRQFHVTVLYAPLDDEIKRKALRCLDWVLHGCGRIGMPVTTATAEDVRAALESETEEHSYQWLMDKIRHLQDLIKKEFEGKLFLYITQEKAALWPTKANPYLFGEEVHVAFPSAAFDIAEAGTCLGFSRGTACVFHLMRVLEIGLGALGAVFGVSLAHTNWAPAIDQIESKIRDMHKDPTWKVLPDCKDQQEFYAQAASHFGILKDGWRNYTAHARGVYTEEQAQRMFDNVADFMKRLATRLHE